MLTFYDLKEWAKKNAADLSSVVTDEKQQLWARLLVVDMVMRIGGGWLYDEYTFSSVASTGTYVFPSRFWKPIVLFDTTNQREISHVNPEDERHNIDRSTSTPWAYSMIYVRQVSAQPQNNGKLTIQSSSSSDVSSAGHTFVVRGLDSTGIEFSESLNMNGTSTVSTSGLFTEVLTASKGGTRSTTARYTSNGTYTLKDSNANTLTTIGPDEDAREYQWIRLVNTPASIINYRLHFLRKPKNVLRNFDNLDVPYSLEKAALFGFEWYVKWFLYDKQDDKLFQLYTDEIQRAGTFHNSHFDDRLVRTEPMVTSFYTPPAGYISRRA